MADKHQLGKGGIDCTKFDAQLMDALDGVLSGNELESFRAHVEQCLECAPVYAQAKAGMLALKSLAEVEPPANLVHNILAHTTAQAVVVEGARKNWGRRMADFISPALAPALGNFAGSFRGMGQPRFAMTMAMAFFSVSIVLNVSGFKMKDLRNVDLRPSSVATSASLQYHETTSKVIKYYENMRLVYELESRLKSLKTSSSEDDNKQQNEQKRPDPNSSERDKRDKQDQQEKDVNYSLQQDASFLAVHFIQAPVFFPVATEGR